MNRVSLREELEQRLAEIPGLRRGPSRWGHGASFFVGHREVAHFHGEERRDLRLTRERIHELSADSCRGPITDPKGL